MKRSTILGSLAAGVLGAQMLVPVASATDAQVAFDATNLSVLVAACGAILGVGLVGSLHRFAPSTLTSLTSRRAVAVGLLSVGAFVATLAPNIFFWGVGLFLSGFGTGLVVLSQPFNVNFIRGLIVGPSLGVVLGLISWRASGAFALLAAGAAWTILSKDARPISPTAEGSATPTLLNGRIRRVSPALVVLGSAMFFPAALSYFRNETLLGRSPVPFAVVLAIGGLLGLWRGDKQARLGRARRSIRQGVWLIIVFGVIGSLLTRDLLPGVAGIVFSLFFSFGAGRLLSSAVTLQAIAERRGGGKVMSYVAIGSVLAVIPLAIAGSESLSVSLREAEQTYARTLSPETFDRGVQSLPAALAMSQDPRVGPLGAPMCSAAVFMAKQHLFHTVAFASGISAVLAFGLSLALPRQRSVRSLSKRRENLPVPIRSNIAQLQDGL